MSAYAELSAAVRDPMREWWKTTGSWLLSALVVCFIFDAWLTPLLNFSAFPATFVLGVGYAVWGLSIVATLLALPVTYILSIRKLLSTAQNSPAGPDISTPRRLPALFLVCARQGVWPLATLTFLRIANHTFYLARDGGAYWWQDALSDLPYAITYRLAYLPLLLVALALYLLTRRAGYSLLLVAVGLGETLWWELGHFHNPAVPPDMWFLKFLFELAVGIASIYVLFYNFYERRKEDWLAAYWFILGAFLAMPFLWVWSRDRGNGSLIAADYFVSGVSYLVRSHGQIGNWLAEAVNGASTPQGGSLLSFIAPVVPVVWKVAWQVGLIYWLYWLLGASWRRVSRASAEPEAVSITAHPAT